MLKFFETRQFFKWVAAIGLVLFLTGCAGLRQGFFDRAMAHERAKAGLELKTVTVNDKTISLLESDKGNNRPTLVLIHGFAASKENWIRFAGHLTDDWHVVAMDLPGHGDSVKDFSLSYSFADHVGYVNEILTHLNITKFHMAGNSMGGAVSALYAAAWPDQVASLTLIDPAGIYVHEAELAGLLARGDNPLIVETEKDFDRLLDFAMEKKPFIPWPIAGVMAEKYVANHAINQKMFAELHGGEMADSADVTTIEKSDFAREITRITAPTLILWGAEDRIVHAGNAEEFHRRIPGSTVVVLEGVGHAPMVEVPEATARIFTEFTAALSN